MRPFKREEERGVFMRKRIADVLWGVFLIGIGLLICGRELGLISFSFFFPGWWTVFLILPCFFGIIRHGFGIFRVSGLLLGTALLLQQNGIIRREWIERAFVPAVFFLIGFSLLIKSMFHGETHKYTGKKSYMATFSGNKIMAQGGEKFEGCLADAVFGGLTLDLSSAEISDGAAINASAIFGGVDIIVPENVRVKMNRTAIFGGVSQDVQKKGDGPVLYINALCMFGGVTVKWA